MHASIYLAVLSALPAALATFSQGTVNVTRDYAIQVRRTTLTRRTARELTWSCGQYTGYASTEDFCVSLRSKYVT